MPGTRLGVLKVIWPLVRGPVPEIVGQPPTPGAHSPPTLPSPPAGGVTEVPDAAVVADDVS